MRAGRVEELVFHGFISFAKDGEAEFGDQDGGVEGVVQVGEVGAQVFRGDVDVGLGAVADGPAEDVGCFLYHAVRVVG